MTNFEKSSISRDGHMTNITLEKSFEKCGSSLKKTNISRYFIFTINSLGLWYDVPKKNYCINLEGIICEGKSV